MRSHADRLHQRRRAGASRCRTPVTLSDQAFVEWFTTFDGAPADEAEMMETFADGVFATGLHALRERFA